MKRSRCRDPTAAHKHHGSLGTPTLRVRVRLTRANQVARIVRITFTLVCLAKEPQALQRCLSRHHIDVFATDTPPLPLHVCVLLHSWIYLFFFFSAAPIPMLHSTSQRCCALPSTKGTFGVVIHRDSHFVVVLLLLLSPSNRLHTYIDNHIINAPP